MLSVGEVICLEKTFPKLGHASSSMIATQQRKVDTRVVVETPEGVDFKFVIAGPGTRAYAWLIDTLLKFGILAFAGTLLSVFGAFSEAGANFVQGLMLLSGFIMDWFYGSLFESWMNGQTPGKKTAGLRVVRTNGTPVDITSAIGRNFLRTADLLPFFYTVGLISMLMTRRMQRLGDLVFDTMVIDERRDWITRKGGLTAKAEPLARSECPKRFSVPERTLAVIERLFESDRIISDARREEIARPLSEALRQRLGYQDPPPDPRNPHAFFQAQGLRHTQFILRVLKTFADDPSGAKGTQTQATAPLPKPGRRSSRSERVEDGPDDDRAALNGPEQTVSTAGMRPANATVTASGIPSGFEPLESVVREPRRRPENPSGGPRGES